MSRNVLSRRIRAASDSITLAVSAKASAMKKAGIDVVGFGAGEPDFDTPLFIKDAAKAALDAGMTKYTPTPCVPELRAAIAEKFRRDNGLNYRPENVTTGAGGKHCLYMAFQAVLDEGDEVVLPSPYWVSYPEQVRLAGGTSKIVEGAEENGFRITPKQLDRAIGPRTKVFLINSPNNPGGHAYSPGELSELADVLVHHPRVLIFSDEIYEKLIYGDLKFASFASLRSELFDRTLTFNCHSKSFAMTGWRVGMIGGPKPIIDAINRLQSQMTSHITSFVQPAAAKALTDPRGEESVQHMRREFERRAHHMWQRLTAIAGIKCIKPQGAFYCFPNITACLDKKAGGIKLTDGVSFASALLEQAKVAVIPGNDCGCPTHVRLSFATSMEQIDKGLDRIESFVKSLE